MLIIYSLFSLSAACLYAQQKYKLSVIKTIEPVTTITWNKDGTNFGYAERNTIVIRDPKGNALVQQIATEKSDIKLLKYSSNTQGLNKDELASLHSDGIIDFRILPSTDISFTQKNDAGGEPTMVACSDNGEYFAVGTKKGVVTLYKIDYAKQTATASHIGNLAVPITALTFSRDNKNLLVGAADNSITRIDVDTKKISNGYAYNAKNKVPILMTADSKSIIMTTGDSTVGFFDLSFNRYNYYTTYRDIMSMHISADNRFLIILTDDNIFSYYDMKTRELKKYIPAFNETKIIAYSFNSRCDKVAVSHEDGSLYVLDVNAVICEMDETRKDFTMTETAETSDTLYFSPSPKPAAKETPAPAPVIEEPVEEPAVEEPVEQPVEETPVVEEPVVEEPTPVEEVIPVVEDVEEVKEEEQAEEEIPDSKKKTDKDSPVLGIFEKQFKMDKEEQRQKFKDGHGFLINVGFATINNDKYSFGVYVPISYRNYNALKPLYFGGTIEPCIYFPVYDFPYEYKINGSFAGNPHLMSLRFYAPFGFAIYPLKNSFEVYAEVDLGMSLNNAWNLRFESNFVASKVHPGFFGSMRIGVAWDFINASICVAYDTVLKAYFCGELGFCVNLGGSRNVGGSRLQ